MANRDQFSRRGRASAARLGVSQVEWILHTHHHRDQCQGDPLGNARRIPIAVPAHERQYFEDAENFWRNRRIFELYYVRNDFFSLTENVRVAALLRDHETFEWRGRKIFIQPSPGHTPDRSRSSRKWTTAESCSREASFTRPASSRRFTPRPEIDRCRNPEPHA